MGRSFNDENAGDEKRSRMLFYLLAVSMTMKSRGFKLIENTKSSSGFEAWRQLIMECEPRVRGRQGALLNQLLNATFKAGVGHRESIETWERGGAEYEEQAEDILPESINANALVQGQEDE
eukprot:5518073-Pyramimonas_sp.AAC.1